MAEVLVELEEALRCLTLIGHVPRSKNTHADRISAALPHLYLARDLIRNESKSPASTD